MGIIQRQGLRNTVIHFFGALFGGIVRVLIMPLFITPAQLGLLALLDFIPAFFMTIFGMGYDQIVIKLFPRFRNDENGHHGFLALGFLLSAVGIAISWLIYYFFGDLFLEKADDLELYRRFSFLIFPLIFFRIVYYNTDNYVRMLFNTVIGSFLESILNRIIVALAVVLFGYMWISFDTLVYLYAFAFCVPGLLLVIYALMKTRRLTLPHRDIFERSQRKQFYQYILFGLLTGASGSIVLYIDAMMVGKMISLTAVGIYTTFFVAARFIHIPGRSIQRVATVVMAEAWQKKDLLTVKEVYEKSCSNQLLIGAYLFGIGLACLEPALSLSPKLAEFAANQQLFLILGLAMMVEMATGVNSAIIATSQKYMYNTYFAISLGVLLVMLNFVLIRELGLTGAALATLMSIVAINIARWYFIYREFALQPFNTLFLKGLLFVCVFLGLCHFIDYSANPWLKIAVNFTVFSLFFWAMVVGLRLAPDFNKWLLKIKARYL